MRFQNSQFQHAFEPDDLARMRRVFDQLCEDVTVAADTDAKRNDLAKAVMANYNSNMDDAMLVTTVLFSYDGMKMLRAS